MHGQTGLRWGCLVVHSSFFPAYSGVDICLLSLSLGHFTLLKRQSRNPIRGPAVPQGRQVFSLFCASTILWHQKKTVDPDRLLAAYSKFIVRCEQVFQWLRKFCEKKWTNLREMVVISGAGHHALPNKDAGLNWSLLPNYDSEGRTGREGVM